MEMKELAELLSFNLRRLRKAKGWTQAKLAERANLSVQTILAYELKKNWPEKGFLERLAKVLKVEPGEFFQNSDTACDRPRDEMIEILKSLAYEDLTKEIKDLRKENKRLSSKLLTQSKGIDDRPRDEMIEILKSLAYEDLTKEIKNLRKEVERLKSSNKD